MPLMTNYSPHPVSTPIRRPVENAPYYFLAESKENNGQLNIFIGIPMEANQEIGQSITVNRNHLPLTNVNIINITSISEKNSVIEIPLKHSPQSSKDVFRYFRFIVDKDKAPSSLEIRVRSSSNIARKVKILLKDFSNIFVLDARHIGAYLTNVPYLYMVLHRESEHYLPNAFIIPNGVTYKRKFDIISEKNGKLENHIILYKDDTHPTKTIIMPHNVNNISFTDSSKKNGEVSISIEVEANAESAKSRAKKIKQSVDSNTTPKSKDDKPKAKAKTKGSDAM